MKAANLRMGCLERGQSELLVVFTVSVFKYLEWLCCWGWLCRCP